MPAQYEGFDLDDSGNIAVRPLTGWRRFTAYGMACCLRVEYLTALDPDPEPSALQLAMTPDQARQLARDLLQMADALSRPPGTGGTPA